jgi:hypothetical protein
LKGNKRGKQEGEWTYINIIGQTVIDYGIVNEEVWEGVEEYRVGKRPELDHYRRNES